MCLQVFAQIKDQALAVFNLLKLTSSTGRSAQLYIVLKKTIYHPLASAAGWLAV